MEIIYWISVFCLVHSYFLYPLILSVAGRKKKGNQIIYQPETLPLISIIISAYNEEELIHQKITSIYSNTYPETRFEVIIGSDSSTDKTNEILTKISKEKPCNFFFYPFATRQGKPNVVNQLINKAKGEILILTDANVIFDNNTLYEMVKHFKNPTIGLVDSNMQNYGLSKSGISIQEKAYISREVYMKNLEGKLWGSTMGPLGGCFAIRKDLYEPVPNNFMVDDFFLCMKVFEKGYKAINELNAKVYEDVSNNLFIEFKRKIRIATGNFQNLARFKGLLWPPTNGVAFSFLSHKVLRWLGPFFLITSLISNIFLIHITLYKILFYIFLSTFFLPFIDLFFRKIQLHIILLRFVTHFYSMNFALMIGFIKYFKGVKSNVWQPTKRNQSN